MKPTNHAALAKPRVLRPRLRGEAHSKLRGEQQPRELTALSGARFPDGRDDLFGREPQIDSLHIQGRALGANRSDLEFAPVAPLDADRPLALRLLQNRRQILPGL